MTSDPPDGRAPDADPPPGSDVRPGDPEEGRERRGESQGSERGEHPGDTQADDDQRAPGESHRTDDDHAPGEAHPADEADSDGSRPATGSADGGHARPPRTGRRRSRGRRRRGGSPEARAAGPQADGPQPGTSEPDRPQSETRQPNRPQPGRPQAGIGRESGGSPEPRKPGQRGGLRRTGDPRQPGGPQGPGERQSGDDRSRGRSRRGRRRGDGPPQKPSVVPEVSTLVAAPTGPAPLSEAEIAEMNEHLAFLRRYKEALRIRFNAVEDLLVNGQRPPSDRGVCHHLLAKVDRTVVERALEREPMRSDAAARSRLLAHAVRLTADVGVLLAYLEALAASRTRAEAADAFAAVAARIDFADLSPARLARLLQVLIETFTGTERVQVLLSLLARPGFRDAYDAATDQLSPEAAEACGPLRAVHRRLHDDSPKAAPTAVIVSALEQILAAPDPVLRGFDEALRAGVLQIAFAPGVPDALAERAARILFPTLANDPRTHAKLGLRRTAQLLRHHADEQAGELLESLCRAQPDHRIAGRWRAALAAPRVGRVAVTDGPTAGGRLQRGFWLDGQRAVWLRTVEGEAAERLAREGALQARLALPGIAAVADHGAADGTGWVAVTGIGTGSGVPLVIDVERPRSARTAFTLAAGAARVLHALALRGVALPDAAPERFLVTTDDEPQLALADLDGVREDAPSAVLPVHAAIARALARALLPAAAATRVEPWVGAAVARALTEPVDLIELVRVLDQGALVAERD